MGAGPDDHGDSPFRLRLLHQPVNPLDKGAGGVHHPDRLPGQGLFHLPGDAVGPEDHRAPRRDRRRILHHLHTHAGKAVHHMAVVDDGTQGHNGSTGLCRLFHQLHRPVHAEAKAGICSNLYLHGAIRS